MRAKQTEKIRELMSQPQAIRNISIIAHVDHGKTTLTDSILAYGGAISESSAGKVCGLDFDPREQEMGITIKSTGMSVYYNNIVTNQESVVNLIDCPGHIDFSGEVTAALRITDGAVVVVDAVEGAAVQTETVLRQACQERIKPILVLNKLDRLFGELHEDSELVYQRLERIISKVNDIISTHCGEALYESFSLHPSKGNVVFASGKQCWAFSLKTFARIYSKKLKNVTEDQLIEKLWGEHYFSSTTKSFLTEKPEEQSIRSFVEFVLSPVQKMYQATASGNTEAIQKMLDKLNLNSEILPSEVEKLNELSVQDRIRKVLRCWLPLSEVLLEVVQTHLPSPSEAMTYRSEYLYKGDNDDPMLESMKNNNKDGELMIFVSKMVPTSDASRFYALGRVFSGNLQQGMKVKVLDNDYVPGKKLGAIYATIQRTYLMMGKLVEPVEQVPSGGIVLILGVDHALSKTGTITTSETAIPIRPLKHAISPIVRVAVTCKKQQELPKLIEAMRMLKKYDPLVEVISDENTGEYIIAGGGELHLKICIEKLRDFGGANIEIIISPPRVQFRESVSSESSQQCLSRSANSLNKLFGTCSPLSEELSNSLSTNQDFDINRPDCAETVDTLVKTFEWNREEAKRLWCFGPIEGSKPTNVLVNLSQAVQNLQAIQPSIMTAFNWSAQEGLLADEPLHGVRFNLMDASVHTDPAHYRSNQIVPAARRLFRACQYVSSPVVLEPMFLAQIRVCHELVGPVYTLLSKRRGIVFSEEQEESISLIEAYLPATESFSFDSALKLATQGRAFPSLSFDHWQIVEGSPFEIDSSAGKIVSEVRNRKGLCAKIPLLAHYLDKL